MGFLLSLIVGKFDAMGKKLDNISQSCAVN